MAKSTVEMLCRETKQGQGHMCMGLPLCKCCSQVLPMMMFAGLRRADIGRAALYLRELLIPCAEVLGWEHIC